MYTSSSGIWQPVWVEPVDPAGVSELVIIPDVDGARLRLTVNTLATNGVSVVATVKDTGTPFLSVTSAPNTELSLAIPNAKLWSPTAPFLYDLAVSVVQNGAAVDAVTSYFGMRKISIGTVSGVKKMLLNNSVVFEMGPLDQGFWPDGIYTAPTDAALRYDIDQTIALGFNLIRKHIKVERQRWYYWADKLGVLVWQDMPSVNSYTGNPQPIDTNQFEVELRSVVKTHWNSPAIIMWDIFNEGQGQHDTAALVQAVKTLDPSRLVNQASGGGYYGVGDVLDNHSYPAPGNPTSTTQAVVDGEYGGIGFQMSGHLWNPALAGGNYVGANTTGDIATIYDSFANDLIYSKANGGLSAAIYTQTTDVENECNGLMTYDRLLKPPLNLINNSNQKAKTGQLVLSEVLPTSQSQGRAWRYTTATAATNWYATAFDDSSWNTGLAGFGTAGTPGAVVRTTWNTSDIWARQQFTLGNLRAADLANLVFSCYHDEDCEIYLNGVLAATASGYVTAYVLLDMNTNTQNALIPKGTNVIAVHCHQTGGGQDIDVGITERTIIADTFTLPGDYAGYWALDETNGTTAADSSGKGNNGTVNSGVWNASGQNGGCLTFNGTSSYAQINRTVSNDFSIAFWVKTTQTAGTGQWYNGKVLVDGDVPGNANDFGSALCGGKFAFGIGNPDTTILSATSINNGAWHYCVATREQLTGAINVYVDGNLETNGVANTNSLTAPARLRFGNIQSGGGFLNGSLDEVRIYNRALGHLQVAALYADIALAPAAPTNLTATAGNAQAALQWTQSLGAASYIVKRSTSSGGPYTPLGTLTATSCTDTNLVNGTTYFYVVCAVNSAGQGPDSAEVSVTPHTLMAWFKADAITGLANGATVAIWGDASGNGNDVTETTPGQQPTYVAGALNGLPVVRFNGANSNYLAFNRPVRDDFTILCVYRSSKGIGTGTAFFQGAGLVNGEMPGTVNDFGVSLNTNGFLLAGTGNPDTTVVSSGSSYANGQPHLFTFRRTRATGALALYADGAQAGSATGGTQSLTSPGRLVLGAQQTLLFFLTGDIAEVKIFNSPLSSSDRAAEESALMCKYGIAGGGGTPPAIPSGLTATAGNRQVSLSWMPATGAASYNLWRSTNNGSSYALLASGLTVAGFVDASAVNGSTNYYEVASVSACGVSFNSAPVAVLLPLPKLGLSTSIGSLALSWPAWANDWRLWSATNLVPPVAWVLVTNQVTSTNERLTVTLPLGTEVSFFRLASP